MFWLIEKKGKYYMIRKELVLGVSILIIILTILCLCRTFQKKEMGQVQQESGKEELKTMPSVESRLKDIETCYLCGNAEESLMGYYRQFDDLGVICLNQWYVFDLGIRNFDEGESLIGESGQTRNTTVSTGEEGDRFYSSQNPGRGISETKINYGKNSILDVEWIRGILCQECLDKILEVMECYGKEGEEPKPRDLCLVDFQTLEVYSLQEQYTGYLIRDYYVRIDEIEGGLEVEAIYTPEMNERANNKKE